MKKHLIVIGMSLLMLLFSSNVIAEFSNWMPWQPTNYYGDSGNDEVNEMPKLIITVIVIISLVSLIIFIYFNQKEIIKTVTEMDDKETTEKNIDNEQKPDDDAIKTLNIRYAKGEITEKEYEKMKKILEE
ncbi:MAG: SHOCT domain-containing protein [Candidatus Tenebribacter burtonii]|nr:SHOCT domain-containing protein [Candidatus Tenebribacter burtonii]